MLSVEGFQAFCSKIVLDTGEPMVLEPWQVELVADFVDPEVRECWCVLPEASGKSTLLGVFALYVLVAVPASTVVLASVTMSQAGSAMYRQASDAVARSPGLARHLRTLDGRLRIYGPSRSRLEVKPSTPNTAQGAIPSLVIIDELGELASLELATMLRGKLTKRPGASMIVISSAGTPGGDFEKVLEGIRRDAEIVHREGRHSRYQTGSTVVHEWRLLATDAITDWPTLKLANPLSTVTEESLQDKWSSPLTSETHFKRYTGGIPERDAEHVISEAVWDAARLGEDEDLGKPDRHIVGCDFAQLWDAFAVVTARSFASGIVLLSPTRILLPPKPGRPIPLEEMKAVIAEACVPAGELWLNPAAGSSPLEEWASDELGLTVIRYGVNQGEAVTLADTFVAALHTGRLRHDGDDILRDHVLNAVARRTWDGNRFAFTRPEPSRTAKHQGTRRIDALSAACLAVVGAESPAPIEPWIEIFDNRR